jgi:Right handed beta helix region
MSLLRSVPVRALFAFAFAIGVFAACGDDSENSERAENNESTGGGCTERVTTSDREALDDALANAMPGKVVCVEGGTYGTEPVVIDRSGREDAPITVRAVGRTVIGGAQIRADYVTITGFDVTGSAPVGESVPGIALQGVGLEVSGNLVHDTGGDGIACDSAAPSCTRSVIARNRIRRADGSGIVVFGEDNEVIGNDVAESVRGSATDADGIRFFGTGHVLQSNRIHDISDDGYTGEPPHTDCFQTFDNGKPPTVDVVIDGNICDNVDHQCLIATAEESGEAGEIGRSNSLRFTNNICRNAGAQALLIQEFPNTLVAFNVFADTIQYRAAVFENGSIDATFVDNIIDGSYAAYEVDGSSAPGFEVSNNLRRVSQPGGVPTEPGVTVADLVFAALNDLPLDQRYQPVPGSPAIDAGVAVGGVDRDFFGAPRPLDGQGTGVALFDVGPYEYQRVGTGVHAQQKNR